MAPIQPTLRVLFDTNVVLDVLLKREPWLADGQILWQAVDEGHLLAYLPASAVTDIFYVARRLTDLGRARQAVQVCLDAFEIATIDRGILERAQALSGSDYEDNVQVACAELNELDAIVTRDPSDFEGSPIPIWSSGECRRRLKEA